MRTSNILRGAGVAIVLAAAVLAGCSGGGHSTATPSTPSNNTSGNSGSGSALTGQTANVPSFTVNIGGPNTQEAHRNGQTIPAANAKSLVVRYSGDSNPTAAPTNPFSVSPSFQIATINGANFVNLTTPNPPGNCTTVGSGTTATLQCTITGLQVPVGTFDMYILVYDQVGGVGNLIYGSVLPITASTSGTLVNANTNAAPSFSLGGNNSAPGVTIALGNGPNPSVATAAATVAPAAAALATTTPYATYGPYSLLANDTNGIAITGTLSPVSVSINDTTSSICLSYAAGTSASPAPTPTPCAYASAGATPAAVTVVNTNDVVYVQYNNRPVTQATSAPWKITAAIVSPAPSATAATTSIPVKFAPAAFSTALASTTANEGAEAVIGSTLYVATTATATSPPTEIESFTLTNGKLALSSTQLPTTLTTGVNALQKGTGQAWPAPTATPTSAASLQGIVQGMTVGPDGNLWFVEQVYSTPGIAVGVYAVNRAVTGVVAQNGVAESTLIPAISSGLQPGGGITAAGITSAAYPTGITSMGGFVWVTDSAGDIIRVNPGVFGGSIGDDSSASGTMIALGSNPTLVTGTPGVGKGLASDITVGTVVGGLTSNSASTGLLEVFNTSTLTQITPVSAPTSTPGGSFLTGTASTDVKAQSTAFTAPTSGILLGSDGNFWAASTTATVGFQNSNLGATATVSSKGANGNSIVQGGLDSFLFAALTTGGVAFTNTSGSISGTITGSNACGSSDAVAAFTGQGLAILNNYLIYGQASSTNFCIVVP